MEPYEVKPGMSVTVKSIDELTAEFGSPEDTPGYFHSTKMRYLCGMTFELPEKLPKQINSGTVLTSVKGEIDDGSYWVLTAAMLKPAITVNKQGLDEFSRLMDGLLEES